MTHLAVYFDFDFHCHFTQINGTKVDGLGFVAARQHLDAARPVARLLVERRPRLAESKYAMGQQTNSELLSPLQSLDIPDQDMTASSEEDGYENDDKSEKKEPDDEDEESQVTLSLHYFLILKFTLNKQPDCLLCH